MSHVSFLWRERLIGRNLNLLGMFCRKRKRKIEKRDRFDPQKNSYSFLTKLGIIKIEKF